MEKVNDIVKSHLKSEYKKACNGYVLALANMWGWECINCGYWVGDEVGGVYAYGDSYVGMDDIIYCVENDIPLEVYEEFVDYTVDAAEFNLPKPTFREWCNGCHRVTKEALDKMKAMKKELNDLCEEEKQKLTNEQ